ncbi:MAG: PIN domain-containing protein [Nitrospinota bacterium]
MPFLLDTTALSKLVEKDGQIARQAKERLQAALDRGEDIYISAPALYEAVRGLLHIDAREEVQFLEDFAQVLGVQELSWADWRRGAEIWADLRKRGHPLSKEDRIDFDVLLGALAISLGATVVTQNIRHFEAIGVPVQDWKAW